MPAPSIQKWILRERHIDSTVSNAPYSLTWSNATNDNYLVTARATDNIGSATTSAARTVRVIGGEASFTGFPQVVPGPSRPRISTAGAKEWPTMIRMSPNNGGQYRNTAVDVETTSDTGGGYNVGWTAEANG